MHRSIYFLEGNRRKLDRGGGVGDVVLGNKPGRER